MKLKIHGDSLRHKPVHKLFVLSLIIGIRCYVNLKYPSIYNWQSGNFASISVLMQLHAF